MPEPHAPNDAHADVSYETTDAKIAPVAAIGIGIILLGLLAHWVCLWMFEAFKASADERQPAMSPVALERPNLATKAGRDKILEPRLQVHEALDMAKFRREENARLNSTGWVDATKGIVHLKIEDAMRLMANPEFAAKHGIRVDAAKGGKR